MSDRLKQAPRFTSLFRVTTFDPFSANFLNNRLYRAIQIACQKLCRSASKTCPICFSIVSAVFLSNTVTVTVRLLSEKMTNWCSHCSSSSSSSSWNIYKYIYIYFHLCSLHHIFAWEIQTCQFYVWVGVPDVGQMSRSASCPGARQKKKKKKVMQ